MLLATGTGVCERRGGAVMRHSQGFTKGPTTSRAWPSGPRQRYSPSSTASANPADTNLPPMSSPLGEKILATRHRAARYVLPRTGTLVQFGGVAAVQPEDLVGDGVTIDDLE